MRVEFKHPPNWEEIKVAFPVADRRIVFFCYGDTIFSPSGIWPSPDVFAHEAVHEWQQGAFPGGAGPWWRKYIDSPDFRLEQEVEAYRAQLAFISALYGRTKRREAGRGIASALSSPLYGSLLSRDAAMERLLA